jgi:hypothetical protein
MEVSGDGGSSFQDIGIMGMETYVLRPLKSSIDGGVASGSGNCNSRDRKVHPWAQ